MNISLCSILMCLFPLRLPVESQELLLFEVHLFAVAPLPSISWPAFAIQTLRALVPAMLVNATLA